MKTALLLKSAAHQGQHARMPYDPERSADELPSPAVCETCGAVYCEDRWQWALPAAGAQTVLCPACRRIREGRAAGRLIIAGEFARTHREEIINLIRHTEMHEKAGHPMRRIMSFRTEDDTLLVDTTDASLARVMGEALERAFKGELWIRHADSEDLLRLRWER